MSLQFGIKEVLNMQMLDYTTKAPKLYVDYAMASTNDVAATRIMVTGGQGNYRLMSFDHTKTSDLKLTIPLVDLNLLAILSGDTLATGAQNIYTREEVTIASDTATISKTPLAGTVPSVFFLSGNRDNGVELSKVASAPAQGEYSISSSTLTFNASDEGETVVVWYQYATASTASKVSVKANKFTSPLTIIGTGLATDQVTENEVATNVKFFKAKAQNNFTITMSSTAVTQLDLVFDLFAEKQTNGDYAYTDYVFLT